MNRTVRAAALAASGLAIAAVAFAFGGVVSGSADAQRPLNEERLANGAPYSFAELIESVSPAVVSVDVRAKASDSPIAAPDLESLPPEFREFFEMFRDGQPIEPPRDYVALGSGFLVSPEGHVVTNFHVVNDATEVTVTLADGEEFEAEILGSDESTDLAVLRIRRDEPFPFVTFADDVNIRVGDWVVAVGNPFGLGGTATAGIVSATGREIGGRYNDFIQLDAPINRGNSGGPAFDLQGRVIGVNSQIFSPSGGNIGIGFAIPAPVARSVVETLISEGRVVRGWLGVTIQAVNADIAAGLGLDEDRGAIVSTVVAGGPAAEAGFRVGDVVLEAGGEPIEDAIDLTRHVGRLGVGERVNFTIIREGREQRLGVLIGERPSEDELNAAAPVAPVAPPDELESGVSFGLTVRPLDEAERETLGLAEGETGLAVDAVARNSEADEQGLRSGEVIVQVGGSSIASAEDFTNAVEAARDVGREAVLLTVFDGRNRRFVALRFDDDERGAER